MCCVDLVVISHKGTEETFWVLVEAFAMINPQGGTIPWGQSSREQLSGDCSRWAIFRWAIFLGGSCPGGNNPGAIIQGVIIKGDNCPGAIFWIPRFYHF